MDNHPTMKTTGHQHDRARRAFTLIEMLTVITIMGIIAALVVTMGQSASQAKKKTAVQAELKRLTVMIDSYQAKLNYYPPDNGGLISNTANFTLYDSMAATNPLIYELTGATNVDAGVAHPQLLVFNSTNGNSNLTIQASAYSSVFNRGGIANADAAEPHNFFQPGPSSKEYANYNTASSPPICGLLVPVEFTNVLVPNFWHYDSSTTNRHNLATYDLWAEYSIGSLHGQRNLITNGNW
jgi:prepilin-type N-terminal cleavage/methylation domain-containing protein